MKRTTKRHIVIIALIAALAPIAAYSFFWNKPVSTYKRVVYINNERLSTAQLGWLKKHCMVTIRNGDYWYDSISGHWGAIGSRSLGKIVTGLKFGRLREHASRGQSAVHINGRRLQWQEVWELQKLIGYMRPGHYRLDAKGSIGIVDGPIIANIYHLITGQRTLVKAKPQATRIAKGTHAKGHCTASLNLRDTRLMSAECC